MSLLGLISLIMQFNTFVSIASSCLFHYPHSCINHHNMGVEIGAKSGYSTFIKTGIAPSYAIITKQQVHSEIIRKRVVYIACKPYPINIQTLYISKHAR